MGFLICACLLHLLLSTADSGVAAQSPARILDATLQDYAFRAFERPRTGIVYNATLPAILTGIALSAVRLRSGSLRRKGFADYFQFGVVVQRMAQVGRTQAPVALGTRTQPVIENDYAA